MQTEHEHLFERVEVDVLAGFTPASEIPEQVAEMVEDEFGEENAALTAALIAHAKQLLTARKQVEQGWTTRTINDGIDAAFADLDKGGVVALQNAGYTQSDGWGDANAIASERTEAGEPRPRGAVFYHGQDVERGVRGHGLFLTFGSFEEDLGRRDAEALAIAREVVAVLARHGVAFEWDGTIGTRIQILPFEWRKRRWTRPPSI